MVILIIAAQDRVMNGLDLLGWVIFTAAFLRIIYRLPNRSHHH
jgi:hypothetical protein